VFSGQCNLKEEGVDSEDQRACMFVVGVDLVDHVRGKNAQNCQGRSEENFTHWLESLTVTLKYTQYLNEHLLFPSFGSV